MNDYRSAMDDFDKKIAHSQSTAGVGTIPIEVVEAVPDITGYNEKVIKEDAGSLPSEDRIYLEPKKVVVKTYRLKK